MWQSLSKNSKIILFALVVLFGIILFSIFRDSSETIDKQKAIDIITNQKIEKALISKPYLYIYTKDKSYKVAKDAIDMDKLFDKTIVEYQDDSSDDIDIVMLIFMVGFTFYIISMIRENQKREREFIDEQREEANSTASSQNILPQISRVNFSDVAGIDEVKEELEEIIDFLKNPDKQ